MSDPDDDALSWAGDDRLQAPRGAVPKLVDDRGAGRVRSGGSFALVALGVLGGVAVVETLLGIRGLLEPSVAASLTTGRGTPPEVVAFGINLVFRALAAAAPVVWFAGALRLVRTPSRRLSWMVLGAVVLVPWPFVLGAR